MSGPEVRTDSDHALHSDLYKTLDLLRLYRANGEPVYFIVQGLGSVNDENPLDDSYLYDEHTCPTNYIPVEAIFTAQEDDPHGVFDYVRSVWYPAAMDEPNADTDAILRDLFPETRGEGVTIEGSVASLKLGNPQ
jgi:hypothetical protein